MVLERCGRGKGKEYHVKTWNIILFFSIISLIVRVSCDTGFLSASLQRSVFYWPQAEQVERRLGFLGSLPSLVAAGKEPAISIFQSHKLLSWGQNVHCLRQCLSPDADDQVCLQCCDTLGPVLAIFRGCSPCSFLVCVFSFKSPVELSPSGIVGC